MLRVEHDDIERNLTDASSLEAAMISYLIIEMISAQPWPYLRICLSVCRDI